MAIQDRVDSRIESLPARQVADCPNCRRKVEVINPPGMPRMLCTHMIGGGVFMRCEGSRRPV